MNNRDFEHKWRALEYNGKRDSLPNEFRHVLKISTLSLPNCQYLWAVAAATAFQSSNLLLRKSFGHKWRYPKKKYKIKSSKEWKIIIFSEHPALSLSLSLSLSRSLSLSLSLSRSLLSAGWTYLFFWFHKVLIQK